MDGHFYTVNRPRRSKKSTAENDRLSAFNTLNESLETSINNCVHSFYDEILSNLESLKDQCSAEQGILNKSRVLWLICRSDKQLIRNEREKFTCNLPKLFLAFIPSLFIHGTCVGWDLIFKQIKAKFKNEAILFSITSANISLSRFLIEAKRAEKEKKLLIVFVLQIECFPRNTFIDNLIEILVNGHQFASCLVMNSAMNFSTIMDRISRMNYTFLNVRTLKLNSPVELLNNIYDQLLNGSVLRKVQFSGDILAQARNRYLYENFSLGELKKCLAFALANYVYCCEKSAVSEINVKRRRASDTILMNEAYVKVLNAFLEVMPINNTITDSVELFLHFHHKIQNDCGFVEAYLANTYSKFSDWSKDFWTAKLVKLEKSLLDNALLNEYHLKAHELRELINQRTEKVVADAVPTPGTPKKNLSMYLKGQKSLLQSAKNLPEPSALEAIVEFIHDLFTKFLVELDGDFIASIPKNRLVCLETSNVSKLDQVMNERLDLDSAHQLDVISLYHVLVDSNTEILQTDLPSAFEKFKAYLADTTISECNLESRFFNALGQLEYIGAVIMGTEDTLRLAYLPSTIFGLSDEEDRFL